MPLNIIRNDITRVQADAIVNTANPRVAVGMGTDSAIYEAAGREELLAERAKIGKMKPGQAAYTPAFALNAKYIIHTVGPAWRGGHHHERETVAACYRNSLAIAEELGCESIAFPLISTGTYGFPKDEALRIAVDEISRFLFGHDMTVYLVVYDKESFVMSGRAFADIRSYIEEEEVMVAEEPLSRDRRARMGRMSRMERVGRKRDTAAFDTSAFEDEPAEAGMMYYDSDVAMELDTGEMNTGDGSLYSSELSKTAPLRELTLEEIMAMKEETFQQRLFRIIDNRGLKDPDVYRRSNLDRKLFSKIRSNVDYAPSKRTVLALIIGLELSLDEATDLLGRAGYSFSPSDPTDILLRSYIQGEMYNIHYINCKLFDYGLKTLGA